MLFWVINWTVYDEEKSKSKTFNKNTILLSNQRDDLKKIAEWTMNSAVITVHFKKNNYRGKGL